MTCLHISNTAGFWTRQTFQQVLLIDVTILSKQGYKAQEETSTNKAEEKKA